MIMKTSGSKNLHQYEAEVDHHWERSRYSLLPKAHQRHKTDFGYRGGGERRRGLTLKRSYFPGPEAQDWPETEARPGESRTTTCLPTQPSNKQQAVCC